MKKPSDMLGGFRRLMSGFLQSPKLPIEEYKPDGAES